MNEEGRQSDPSQPRLCLSYEFGPGVVSEELIASRLVGGEVAFDVLYIQVGLADKSWAVEPFR